MKGSKSYALHYEFPVSLVLYNSVVSYIDLIDPRSSASVRHRFGIDSIDSRSSRSSASIRELLAEVRTDAEFPGSGAGPKQ